MPRPKSDDPAINFAMRLPQSVLEEGERQARANGYASARLEAQAVLRRRWKPKSAAGKASQPPKRTTAKAQQPHRRITRSVKQK